MSALPQTYLALAVLTLIVGIALGYVIGSKSSRKHRRELQHDLNQQSLKYLDLKSDLNKLEKSRDQFSRKDRLLKHTLQKLADLQKKSQQFDEKTERLTRQHYLESSRLQVAAAEARQQARRAANAASLATRQLHRLEKLTNNTQTIQAPKPKSYGHGDPVNVSVVDQHSPAVSKETVSRVSNRDSVRLSQLRSSNEGKRYSDDSLQAISGICAAVERSLNEAGIHGIEQLANISDRELIELHIPANQAQTVAARAHWKTGAKELLQQRSN